MLNFNDNITLTLCVNLILFVMDVIVMSHCIRDMFWKSNKAYKYFIVWIAMECLHLMFHSAYRLLLYYSNNLILQHNFFGFIILTDLAGFSFYGRWIVGLVEETHQVNKYSKFFSLSLPLITGVCFFIPISLGISEFDSISTDKINDIKLLYFLSYFTLIVMCILYILYYRKVFGKVATFYFCVVSVLPYIFALQIHWQITPINIVSSFLIVILYLRVWEERKNLIIEQEKKLALQNSQLAQLRTETMQSQIKPHFIYNTLSAIAALCTIDPKKAKAITLSFSEYLRGNLKSITEKGTVPFSKELDHVNAYLNVEKARFEDKLNIEYHIGTMDFYLPPLTVQPIVENAVKHGITKNANGGTVKIITIKDMLGYRIIIEDDGVGFDSEKLPENDISHLGISNVRERIIAMCSGSLTVRSKINIGTSAEIFIPAKDKNEYDENEEE